MRGGKKHSGSQVHQCETNPSERDGEGDQRRRGKSGLWSGTLDLISEVGEKRKGG